MKSRRNRAFTILEMAVTSGITAAVVGTTCAVTLICAKLTQSSVSTTNSTATAAANVNQITSDISKADAVLNSFTFSGGGISGAKKVKSNGTEIVLRIPRVDSAGRPQQGKYKVVYYGIRTTESGKVKLRRLGAEVNGNIVGPASSEDLGQAASVTFTYTGKSSGCGGPIKNAVSTVKDLTSGSFDGAVSVDPSTAVLPNISGASYVSLEVQSEDRKEKQKIRTGVRLRNSVL